MAAGTIGQVQPNLVLILADDLGYGDLSVYGAHEIHTPELDAMAAQGARFTQFYVVAPLCTPSRGSLITGLHPPRTGLTQNLPAGLPSDPGGPGRKGTEGIDEDEVTLAEALRAEGYATGLVGKWHLGHLSEFLPTHHGFDFYYGIPAGESAHLLLCGEAPCTEPVGLDDITRAYTEQAIAFIERVRDQPFFLMLAHRTPHVPLAVSAEFRGTSARGLYGDVVEELDWSVGQVLLALREAGVGERTLVFVTSDHGPWLAEGDEGGSAGPLRGGKGTPFEGGIRVPALARWPEQIPPGRVITELASTLDLFPTFVALAGGPLPEGRPYGGQDLRALLTGAVDAVPGPGVDGGRELVLYFSDEAVALRSGRYKYLRPGFWWLTPLLFDVESDRGETQDLSLSEPTLAQQLAERLDLLEDRLLQGAKSPKK
jgi:arylsulfatase A-like enzyme